MMDLPTPLTRPRDFYRTFGDRHPSWLISLVGFYLAAFVEAVGNLSYSEPRPSNGAIWAQSLVGSVVGALVNVVLFGILWLYLGTKIFRGRTSLRNTLLAAGYAFFWPGIIGLLTSALTVIASSPGAPFHSFAVMSVIMALQVALGLWGMGYAVMAVKHLNSFNWPRTIGALLWFPVLISLAVLVVYSYREAGQ